MDEGVGGRQARRRVFECPGVVPRVATEAGHAVAGGREVGGEEAPDGAGGAG